MPPAYPMLFAGGAVWGEQWLASLTTGQARLAQGITWGALVIGALSAAAVALPLAPVNSPWWNVASDLNDGFKESLGWPELAETVAGIYAVLPAAEKAQTGILAGNYGAAMYPARLAQKQGHDEDLPAVRW